MGIDPEGYKDLGKHKKENGFVEEPKSLNKYIQMIMPETEEKPKENNKKKPISDIIPAFHFSCNCPSKKLELALMADLEKHMETGEIIKYRQEMHDLYDFKEYEKQNMRNNANNSGYSKIYNYFQSKGGITIQKNENSRIVRLVIKLNLKTISIKFTNKETRNYKEKEYLNLSLYLYDFYIKEICIFTQPNVRINQLSYDRNSVAKIKIRSIEGYDLRIKECKMVKSIFLCECGLKLKIVDVLKIEYIKNCFNETITKTISVDLPSVNVFIVPELVLGVKNFFSKIFSNISKHPKEDYLMDLLEPFQERHISPKQENSLILNFFISKLEISLPATYNPNSPMIKCIIGGVSFKSSNKLSIEVKYIDAIAGTITDFQSVNGLFIPYLFTTHSMKIAVVEEKTEIVLKLIQMELSRLEILYMVEIIHK